VPKEIIYHGLGIRALQEKSSDLWKEELITLTGGGAPNLVHCHLLLVILILFSTSTISSSLFLQLFFTFKQSDVVVLIFLPSSFCHPHPHPSHCWGHSISTSSSWPHNINTILISFFFSSLPTTGLLLFSSDCVALS
jgi:hypothetical protein